MRENNAKESVRKGRKRCDKRAVKVQFFKKMKTRTREKLVLKKRRKTHQTTCQRTWETLPQIHSLVLICKCRKLSKNIPTKSWHPLSRNTFPKKSVNLRLALSRTHAHTQRLYGTKQSFSCSQSMKKISKKTLNPSCGHLSETFFFFFSFLKNCEFCG